MITIGADPEVFVQNKEKLVSGFDMVKGDKQNPHVVDKGAVQVDGMALEFNIDPVKSKKKFQENIFAVMKQLEGMLPNDHQLAIVPTAEFGMEYIKSQPEKAKELGCEPDYNAYTKQENPKPNGELGFRTAAGHIHIGWTEGADIHSDEHFQDCCSLVKVLDSTLFLLSLVWDKDSKRRELYGSVGSFRPKPYGCEYRVLSNVWLKNSFLTGLVYSVVTRVLKLTKSGRFDFYLKYANSHIKHVVIHPLGYLNHFSRYGVITKEERKRLLLIHKKGGI